MKNYLITYKYVLYTGAFDTVTGTSRIFIKREKITADDITKMEKNIVEGLVETSNKRVLKDFGNAVEILYITKLDN